MAAQWYCCNISSYTMDINVCKRQIGVNFNAQSEAEVTLWAPLAIHPAINAAGKLSIPLAKKDFGYWTTTTNQLLPGDQYYFVMNEGAELPDPASLAQPGGVHDFSQAVDLGAFNWTDQNWLNPALRDYIFYELHTGTFTGPGTFEALENKLDHLIDLGITAIEIMPVAQFPGERNWGYDGVFPFAVQNSYGGAFALQHLVNTCHQKGLAVVLDVVYNHLGPEGNYLGLFGKYFTDKYQTPWGNAINFDDAYSDGVRHYFIENALMWFRDFHIDALRMDAVHAIKDFGPKHILQEIKEYVNELMQATGKKHYLIVECDLNDTRFIEPLSNRGYGMDAQWIDEFHHALRVTAGQQRHGYYTDFKGIGDLAKAYTDAYVYDGQYSQQRAKKFGVKADDLSGDHFVAFSQNHDQVGNRMLGERTSQLESFEMQKLLAAAVMASPYLPMLFMGEEYAETHPFLYFVSHGEPELIAVVRKGRKEEFKEFHAEGEAPDPQAVETFEQSKLQWGHLTQEPHQTMLAYYKELISLRKKQPALKTPSRKSLKVSFDEKNKTLLLSRSNEEQSLICIMNFSAQIQSVVVPENINNWQKLFDSADPKWKGPGSASGLISAGQDLSLQPESILIYTQPYA